MWQVVGSYTTYQRAKMVVTIAIDAPLSAGIRKSKNLKKDPIKKTSDGIKKKFFGESMPSRTRRSHSGGQQKTEKFNKISIPLNGSRKVRINISNLAPTVLLDDLRQLFGEFQPRNVSVNFNENGKPAGTGDIILSKRHADRLVEKYSGVALDGKEMIFAIIDEANIANSVKFPETSRRISNGKAITPKKQQKRTKASGQKKVPRKLRRENKPKMTVEELNAELDAYMAHSH